MAALDALPALPRDPDGLKHPFCRAMRVYKAAQAPTRPAPPRPIGNGGGPETV